ncbi:probable bifunctional dTTP/UTP pyrophosphatase/methyltransferase protein [Ambystoma mexicanum]|uniref:probable bifunctional dTTP/UTP pyrophosphatase/methyltransferase protein n=1 Tax=Ambystoma mexicanum TaxID=8296 RepID=UPI0037E7EDDF
MMLNPVISKLAGKRVVLASSSPRRQDILTNVGLRFEVVPSWFKETLDKSAFTAPHQYAVETAKQKALEVARRVHEKHLKTPDIVIGADTIVTLEGDILEKPVDKQDAYNMLSRLSGKEHSVFTGVAIIHCNGLKDSPLETEVLDFYEETKVKFADLSEDLLWEYVHSGEPMDKAGGYGIQALGGMLVESVNGDFLNVVGFPLNHFCKKLAELYYPPSKSTIQRIKHDSIPYVETFENLSDLENDIPNKAELQVIKELDVNGALPSLVNNSRGNGDAGSQTCSCMPTASQNGVVDTPAEFPATFMNLLDGFRASKALFVATKLKVFDTLKDKGALMAEEVSRQVSASERGIKRLLDACVSLELLEKRHQVYSNSKLANTYLVSDSKYSINDYILYSNDRMWPFFTNLESAVTKGAHHHQPASDKNPESLTPDSGCGSPDAKHRLMAAMHCTIKVTARDIATAFDLSHVKSACDLGGCTGALAYELVDVYPNIKVTVFDLPDVIGHVSSFTPTGSCTCRVTFTAGDFFNDSLPEVDLYILSRVLHDLADEKLDTLLTKISAICTPGAALLLGEIVLDKRNRNPRGLLQALTMSEGEQRTGSEYMSLMEKYGFNNVQIKTTGNFLDAVLAVKR